MRARAAAAVCAVVAAGVVAGCGNGTDRADGGKGAAAKPLASGSGAVTRSAAPQGEGTTRMLTQAELEQAVVGAADLPGWTTGTTAGKGGDGVTVPVTVPDVSKIPRISPAACQPLWSMTGFGSRYQIHGIVEQGVSTVTRSSLSEMALTSYSAADAPRVMADLRASLRACRTFRTTDPGESYGNPVVLPGPRVGDEAVAYRLTQTEPSVDANGDDDGGPPSHAWVSYEVVRSGATIAAFYILGFEQPLPRVPEKVVTAQVDKLVRVRRALG